MEGSSRTVQVRDERLPTFAPPAILASGLLLLGAALVLCVRRASGAFSSPLPALPLIATAWGLLAWAIGVRAVTSATHARWLPTAVLVAFAIACSFPGSRLIDWTVWLPVFFLDWWAQKKLAGLKARPFPVDRIELDTEQQIQQLTRVRTADGSDAIRGALVAEFAAGERNAVVFAAFCPPFEHLPEITAQIADDSSATVKIVQRLHNGVQFEVRLPHSAASRQNVIIEFFATSTSGTQ
jgi:hypothetical protein